jgi:putative nucleotidyltransferase with HDIG domain
MTSLHDGPGPVRKAGPFAKWRPEELIDLPLDPFVADQAGRSEADPDGGLDLSLEALLDEMEQLPMGPSTAMRVLWVAASHRSSAQELGEVVASDPALTTRVMRMANSPYYGLGGRVGSSAFAVTVLGFETVRALAVLAAVVGDGELTLPEGFWIHSALVSSAAGLLADRCGVPRPDAFSLGLLHDLGRALLHRLDERLDGGTGFGGSESADPNLDGTLEAETGRFGADHAEVAARLLASWRFPADFCNAVRHHHRPLQPDSDVLTVVLVASEALAALADGTAVVSEVIDILDRVGVRRDELDGLVARVGGEGRALSASLG